MPLRLIVSFDSEDYETPASDDAERWWAALLAQHGITGCFCVVGEEARALRARGRRDVLAALAGHEIAYHSNYHSMHPTHAEKLDELGWADGVRWLAAWEAPGLADLQACLGQRPSAYCKPGNSWGPQVPHVMAQLGVPVFCDAPLEWAPGRPMWYADGLLLRYHTSFDRYFRTGPTERVATMQRDFLTLLAHNGPDGWVVLYTHPCRLVTAAFPGNFTAGRNPPRAEWQPAPLRPAAEVATLKQDFAEFVRWIVEELARQHALTFATYRDLAAAYPVQPSPWLTRSSLATACTSVAERPAPVEVPVQSTQGGAATWLSPADLFGAVVWALARTGADEVPPTVIPVRRLLGPTDAPATLDAPMEVSADDLIRAARVADQHCDDTRTIPAALPLGATSIGPNAFLQAGARALVVWQRDGRLPHTITLQPVPEEVALAQRDDVTRLRFARTWSIFPPEFEGRRLLAMIRWQLWSARPA